MFGTAGAYKRAKGTNGLVSTCPRGHLPTSKSAARLAEGVPDIPAISISETILERLKRETRAQHEQIEGAVGILRPDVARADYLGYLTALFGYYLPLETRIRNLRDLHRTVPDLDRRWKASLLECDLRALGLPEAALRELPICRRVPLLGNVSRALGCLYVLEGSTLGGQIIQRMLRARLPGELQSASAFLNCYGPETGSMWRELGHRLTANAASVVDEDDMVAAATETFGTLKDWFVFCQAEGGADGAG